MMMANKRIQKKARKEKPLASNQHTRQIGGAVKVYNQRQTEERNTLKEQLEKEIKELEEGMRALGISVD